VAVGSFNRDANKAKAKKNGMTFEYQLDRVTSSNAIVGVKLGFKSPLPFNFIGGDAMLSVEATSQQSQKFIEARFTMDLTAGGPDVAPQMFAFAINLTGQEPMTTCASAPPAVEFRNHPWCIGEYVMSTLLRLTDLRSQVRSITPRSLAFVNYVQSRSRSLAFVNHAHARSLLSITFNHATLARSLASVSYVQSRAFATVNHYMLYLSFQTLTFLFLLSSPYLIRDTTCRASRFACRLR
jgi:hypothetical protein